MTSCLGVASWVAYRLKRLPVLRVQNRIEKSGNIL